MPKHVDKNKVRQCILSQTQPFTPDDIAFQTNVSSATTRNLILELKSQGHVVLDHKDGRRIYYGTTDKATSVRKESNIMSLPVKERFKYVAGVVDMVVNGHTPSALITGVAGIGKTHMVLDRFKAAKKKENMDYHVVKGHSAPMGLYRFLHDHNDSCIVFDDCDSVFKDDLSLNLLKSALDSYEIRKIHWLSERMPEDLESSFEFTGQIVFVSNFDAERISEPVKSRTMLIDLQMSRSEIVEYMREIVGDIIPTVSMKHKLEVIDFLDETKDSFAQFNLRTLIKVGRIRQGVGDNRTMDWKKMAMVVE